MYHQKWLSPGFEKIVSQRLVRCGEGCQTTSTLWSLKETILASSGCWKSARQPSPSISLMWLAPKWLSRCRRLTREALSTHRTAARKLPGGACVSSKRRQMQWLLKRGKKTGLLTHSPNVLLITKRMVYFKDFCNAVWCIVQHGYCVLFKWVLVDSCG